MRNRVNGYLAIAEIENGKIMSINSVINSNNGKSLRLNQNWEIIAGNVLGTPQDDLILRNKNNGSLRIGEMNGSEVIAEQKIVNVNNNPVFIPQNWQMIMGNFTDSNQDDIVTRDNYGNLYLWQMQGNQIVGFSPLTDPNSVNSSFII